jgi:sulfite exporter TauE/SafE
MEGDLSVLLAASASIGFLHTILGPDHYIPFVAIARARKWSLLKTSLVTSVCGLGHIAGSVILGIIGIALGTAISQIEVIEEFRGDIAGWLLIGFGLVYMIWGIRRAIKNKPHTHTHTHPDGTTHLHKHTHNKEHSHIHAEDKPVSVVPWTLFIIFAFGPCEPLIPILMYPALQHNIGGAVLVTAVFGVVTIATMLGAVIALYLGVKVLPFKRFERYAHSIAGAVVLLSGIAVVFLGL